MKILGLAVFPPKRRLRVYAIAAAVLAVLLVVAWAAMLRMPGRSHTGPLPPLDEATRALRDEVEADVRALASGIGERNMSRAPKLEAAAVLVERRLAAAGLAPRRETYGTWAGPCSNVLAEVPGRARASEIVVVGAHYDSVEDCPGANDNASGVAAMLAIAARLAGTRPARTLRFAAFVNEEPPWFMGAAQGSSVHARGARSRGEDVVAMLSLETLGCYRDGAGTQTYPLPGLGLAYPTRGDFVAFVGNVASRGLVREAIGEFRRSAAFPSEGAALPGWVPGIGWSDHRSFWLEGYDAVMVTDTAPFRYPQYHTSADLPEHVDFERLARVTSGLVAVVRRLANP